MSEYTAEDFKDARFAVHGHGAKAVRWEMNYRVPWHTAIGDRFSDEEMAENGWRPVREHNQHAPENDYAVKEREILRAEVRNLRRRIGELLDINAGLRDDLNARIEFVPAPLTLDTLREAWENAEVPTEDNPIREGDTVIWHGGRGYTMAVADISAWPHNVRVLRRAPHPEPWEELRKVLSEIAGEPVEPGQARWAYEFGVRVTGGGDQ